MEAPSDRRSPEQSTDEPLAENVSPPPLTAPLEPTLRVEPLEGRVLLTSDMSPAAAVVDPAAMEPAGPALIGPAVPGTPEEPLTNAHVGPAAKEAIADITADQNSGTESATPSEKDGSLKPSTMAEQHAEPIEMLAETDQKAEPEQEKLDGAPEPDDPIATIEPEHGSQQKNTDYERLVVDGASVITKLEATGVIDQISAEVAQQSALRQEA